jgi:3'-5' exonuclease
MINIPINKLLFLDIETSGIEHTFKDLKEKRPPLAFMFEHYYDWFQKRFPEDGAKTIDEMFYNRSALIPEFARIVCISFAFVTDGGIKMQSINDVDEKKLLEDTQKILHRVGELGFFLCGHNVKGFDIPMMAKRMMINGILPPKILPGHDVKPWEVKALDTKDLWQYGSYGTIASLELMCAAMGVESSKSMEIVGDKVHKFFWENQDYEGIKKYCEKDVEVLIKVIEKLTELK